MKKREETLWANLALAAGLLAIAGLFKLIDWLYHAAIMLF